MAGNRTDYGLRHLARYRSQVFSWKRNTGSSKLLFADMDFTAFSEKSGEEAAFEGRTKRLTTHDCLGRARCPAQLGTASIALAERRHNSRKYFLFGLLEGGRLFRAHAIKHACENRNVGLVLDQRTEMIGVK